MSITSSVAQQYELINERDASLVGEKPAFQDGSKNTPTIFFNHICVGLSITSPLQRHFFHSREHCVTISNLNFDLIKYNFKKLYTFKKS